MSCHFIAFIHSLYVCFISFHFMSFHFMSFMHSFHSFIQLIHSFSQSVSHWFFDSLLHWVVDSLTHWIGHSLVHWCTDSFVHWVIDSLSRWTIDSLVCCFCDSMIYWFADLLIHQSTDSLTRWIMTHWFIQWTVHGFFHFIVISVIICSFVDAPHNFNTSWLLHRKSFPIAHWFPIAMFCFRNFRPGAGRALPGIQHTFLHQRNARSSLWNSSTISCNTVCWSGDLGWHERWGLWVQWMCMLSDELSVLSEVAGAKPKRD